MKSREKAHYCEKRQNFRWLDRFWVQLWRMSRGRFWTFSDCVWWLKTPLGRGFQATGQKFHIFLYHPTFEPFRTFLFRAHMPVDSPIRIASSQEGMRAFDELENCKRNSMFHRLLLVFCFCSRKLLFSKWLFTSQDQTIHSEKPNLELGLSPFRGYCL